MEEILYYTVGACGCLLTPSKDLTSDHAKAAKFTTLAEAREFARCPEGVRGIHDRTIDEYYHRDSVDKTAYMREVCTVPAEGKSWRDPDFS